MRSLCEKNSSHYRAANFFATLTSIFGLVDKIGTRLHTPQETPPDLPLTTQTTLSSQVHDLNSKETNARGSPLQSCTRLYKDCKTGISHVQSRDQIKPIIERRSFDFCK